MNSQSNINKYICLILCCSLFVSGCASNHVVVDASTPEAITLCESAENCTHSPGCYDDSGTIVLHSGSEVEEERSIDWNQVGKVARVTAAGLLIVSLFALDVAIVVLSKGHGNMACSRAAWSLCD